MVAQEIQVINEPQKLRSIMRSDQIVQRFEEIVGKGNAGGYISSVLVAVAQNPDLQNCEPNSIIGSAIRAATMKLSVDPAVSHAYMVPFKDKGTPKATFMVGYKGIQHMAIRSGKYRRLNLVPVYASDKIIEDRLTGDIAFQENCANAAELHNRHIGKDLPIGYLLYIELTNGYKKTFFMTCEECDVHGRKYSKNYFNWGTQEPNPKSMWHKDPHAMYKKTVIRLGIMKFGYLDPQDLANMSSNDEAEEVEDYLKGVEIKEVPHTMNDNLSALGFGDDPETKQLEPTTQPTETESAITFEEACAVKSADGKMYVAMSDDEMRNQLAGLEKMLITNLNQREQDDCLKRVDAIKVILETRTKNTELAFQSALPL